jgi:hypothetical protein
MELLLLDGSLAGFPLEPGEMDKPVALLITTACFCAARQMTAKQ